MPFPGGLGAAATFSVAAAFCLVPATFCVTVLLRVARSQAGVARAAYVTLATAVSVSALALGAVAVVYGTTDGRGLPTVAAAGVGFGLASLALLAGLLMLPAVVVSEARGARILDGLLLTSCAFYLAWALYLERWHEGALDTETPVRMDAECAMLAVPTLLLATVLGTATVSGFQLAGSHAPALTVCVGAGLFSLGSGGLLVASRGGGAGLLVALSVGILAAGYVALALAARRIERTPAPEPSPERQGAGIATVAVAVTLGAYVARLVAGGTMDKVSIYTAVAIGGFLAAQQGLARRDIGQYAERLAESEAHFRRMAHTDALTGIANRRELLRTLQEEAAGGPPCVLLAIDLDGFKNINEVRGHDVGDAVLREVGRRLRSNVRPGDCPARVGGDEFAVLMWARPSEASTVAERILEVLSRPYELPTGTVFISASVGMAGCATADSIDSLLRNADLALRFAKQSGKNRVEAYDAAYDEVVRRRTDLEHELRGALERRELMLVYQPVVALADDRIVGVEALLRWHHPRLGSVPPAEFIPLAEEVGLIHGLGSFVLHEACHQLSRWLNDGHDIWLSINVSVRELHTPEYAQQVREVLRSHRMSNEHLVVEVTEHAAALDVAQLVERLAALRDSGIRVALDDFGAGYSSLNLLRRLPVDTLKIDRALLDSGEPASTPLVDVVVRLGRRLGLNVIAEGVSTPAQRAMLESCDCQYAQGELFGGAMPAEHVEARFRALPSLLPAQADPAGDG